MEKESMKRLINAYSFYAGEITDANAKDCIEAIFEYIFAKDAEVYAEARKELEEGPLWRSANV